MRKSIEALEERLYWTVTEDSNGWTVVTEPVGSKVIYVSSSTGNDSNPGTMAAPVATLNKAQALSTSGPNEILLKSGDTFTESSSSNLDNWTLSGQSLQAPFLLSYYGTGPRPMIYAGVEGNGFATGKYSTSGTVVNYLDVIGLQFDANLRDPTLGTINPTITSEDHGIQFDASGGNSLFEDCTITYFGAQGGDNIDIEANSGGSFTSPSINNITIRRCVDDYAWGYDAPGTSNAKAEGLYAFNVSGLSIVQSTFYQDGWLGSNPAYAYCDSDQYGENHDIYIASTCSNFVCQQNVLAAASYAGLMARAGGDIDYNIFVNDTVACAFGAADGADSTVGGVSGNLIGNVIVGDQALNGTAFGQGFVIANTAPGAGVVVEDNVFTQDSQNAKPAITLTMATDTTNPAKCVGINDLTIENNVINGWRWGIQLDGRFVPGATGLYALNGLTISHNDFVNGTVSLVRQDGAFAASAESWSGDRYIDTLGLNENDWVLLQSKDFAFSSWSTAYDVGAQALFTLPYSDPSRSAATYDTTQGGPGQLSIYNYRPAYMAQAAITYIDAGFNITSTGGTIGGGGGTPSAGVVMGSAVSSDVNATSLGATTYTFTVNYLDPFVLNSGKLGNNNIMVTGPNGFYELATFISAGSPYIDSNNYQHTVATYRITPPSGAWTASANGTYTIILLPDQPLDSSGAYAQTGAIGTFIVDVTNPVAMAVVPNITSSSAGASSTSFTVTYFDPYGIDITTLNSFEVQVTGPNNYSQYAAVTLATMTANSETVVATYSLAAPNGSWTAAANGTYTVTMLPGSVADLEGNTVASGVLATFTAQVGSSNASAGTASISGTVFNDANGNGIMDPRELPLTNVTVFIDENGTGVYAANDPTATTDPNSGTYTFTGLQAGRYVVYDVVPTGYAPTTPSTGYNVVTLTTGQAATAVNFGDQVSSVIINSVPSTPATTIKPAAKGKAAGIP